MIIDFTISNFCSIQSAQTFSMFVDKVGDHLADNVAYPVNDKIGVLKVAGIYGANASGKSNLLKAFMALHYMAVDSGDLKNDEMIGCYQPFELSEKWRNAPTEFEIEFIVVDGQKQVNRCIYKITFDAHQVIHESLYLYTSSSKSKIFERTSPDWKDITFGKIFKGGKKLFPLFESNSYLSKAGNSADAPQIIRDVYDYLRMKLFFLAASTNLNAFKFIVQNKLLPQVTQMVKSVDTGIENIELNVDIFGGIEINRGVNYRHRNEEGGLSDFSENMVSSGTKSMLHVFPAIIYALQNGCTIMFDEIEISLHPHVAELIIRLFNDPEVNVNNAQLIFTSHNPLLMSSNFMRRDQLWLVEKKNGVSELTCLSEFDPSNIRKNSPFGEWYADGRFGAIPSINYYEIAKSIRQQNGGKHE